MTDMPPQKPFILIDGSSYLHRAFHALPSLVNSHGEPTGAIYGVLNMIRKLIVDYDPTHIAVVFDPRGKTTRNAIYPQYKAHRPTMLQELSDQVQPLFTAIQAMGLPLIQLEGIEADDVIATLAIQARSKGWHVLISTGDKDMAQLVDEQITLINTMSNLVLDRAGVMKKFGVPPERIIDYLALIGDSSDNIPGVPKVGPVTAIKWLQEYDNLENIMAHAANITGRVGENLRASLTTLPLARQLVTLQSDVELPCTLEALQRRAYDEAKLIELFKRLEFKNWLQELLNKDATGRSETVDYSIVVTRESFEQWLEKLQAAETFAFNLHTTATSSIDAQIVGLSFAITKHQAIYIPVAHDYLGAPQQLSRAFVLAKLTPLLEDKNKKIIGHDIKCIMNVLANYGITLGEQIFDTMLESYVLDSAATRHDVTSLALKYAGKSCTAYEFIAGKGVKQLAFNQLELQKAGDYAAEKVDAILQIHQALWPRVTESAELTSVLSDIELPLVSVLSHIERNGVQINTQLLQAQSQELAVCLQQLEEKAYQLAGTMFNLASPKQLQDILYTQLKLPVLEKTPTGAPSTAESVLQELALDYPLPKLILEHRSLSKIKSTYTDSLPKQINPTTGRVHTSYNQAVTSTGRLSSTDPNLQNIPIRNQEGRKIRQAFIASPGYKIISADYSQIELRIMAHLSQDPGLLSAFKAGLDIHTATAAEVFNTAVDKVSAEQRRHAKAINFGLIYGMSAFGLARQLNIERELAQTYIDQYFTRYPNVQTYMEQTRELARTQGYVKTVWGRRLYVPDIASSQMMRRRAAERAAINAPMQGTAADLIKLAMIHLDRWLNTGVVEAKMIMQVHDELVFEVAETDVEVVASYINQAMTSVANLAAPLEVHISVGNNWDEAH